MSASLASLVTFLLKYPPRDFARGTIDAAPVVPIAWLVGAAAVLLALVGWRHARLVGVPTGRRVLLGALRATLLLAVVALLVRPVLVVSSAAPRRNALLVLFDDSESMRVADGPDRGTRLAAVQAAFADSGATARALAERFRLRPQRFGADVAAIPSVTALGGGASRTDLVGALERALSLADGTPVAGVVLVSDGAATPPAADAPPLPDLLARFRARGLPVHAIAVGSPRLARNVAVADVAAPTRALAGAALDVPVRLATRGLDGERVRVVAERDGRRVAEREVRVPDGADGVTTDLAVPLIAGGVSRLTVRAEPLEGEALLDDNAWHLPILVDRGPRRVLYVEGEVRPEFRFLRSAVAGDSALEVVGLLRSAEDKYLRLGVRDSLELFGGLPADRATLFAYDAIVLGSFEAAAMTGDQRRMFADFVERRGGGLLALGGRAAFAEGGYTGTPLAEVLPVTFDGAPLGAEAPVRWLRVAPTRSGARHPALRLAPPDSGRITPWDSLPLVTSVNTIGTPRAGATVLLDARATAGEDDETPAGDAPAEPVLVTHRYGRGTATMLGVQDTWLWQMDTRVAVDDVTHRTIWRQLLRWLVADVPSRVQVRVQPARIAAGEPVVVVAEVADATFTPATAADVVAEIERTDGRLDSLVLRADPALPGTWRGMTRLDADGTYTVRVLARVAGAATDTTSPAVDTARAALLVDGAGSDLAHVERDDARLAAIAEATGGTFRTLDALDGLPDDAMRTESGIVTREARDLWDMPAVLIVMLVLMTAEWSLRRRAGLA